MAEKTAAIVIYDGECPFCSRYVRLMRVREAVGTLHLVNARDGGPEVNAARARGLNLDEGMVLILGGQFYHGADCLNRLALLSSRSGIFNRITYIAFRSPMASKILYPVLRAGRNATLRLLGRPPLTF
ncbi:DUF393 domain-containing protein [Limibaculum sp. FT325]|uniref:DCC1-like thiol-disulfide oxidoreductase family protein n=1 Tax=Thermohalobaculum sediminis TaxID=2939436 RepID=UPI0020C042F1|nr:DCC1-like thiol-disulfide oxidoreductase family protein [Limibaculum sediminis]MCL5778575.1 DUF393 domain-containing protein [Limibaculum sediminis]